MNKADINLIEKTLGVSSEILDKWINKLNLQKYKIGEAILTSTSISKSVLLLISGKIRLRGISNKKDKKFFSLGVLNSPELIGLVSNRIQKPIEIVSACSDCIFLSIPYKEWNSFQVEIQNNEIKAKLGQIDLSELWYLLNENLESVDYPDEPRELKKFLKTYQEIIVSFNSFEDFSDSIKKIKSSDFNWLTLKKIRSNQFIYESISYEELKKSSFKNTFGRIIGLPTKFIDIPFQKSSKNSLKEKKSESKESNLDKGFSEEERFYDDKTRKTKDEYKFFSSQVGIIDETTACFQMLASMLDIPLRKDSVRRILEENINKKTNDIGLDLCAAIAESLGLKTQLAKIPANLFQRSLTPLFIKSKNKKIVICFDVNKESVIVGEPNDEIKEISLESFLSAKIG